jgi:hypothetical protein
MKKFKRFLIIIFLLIISISGWLTYEKATDETYGGMSIIPEKHPDIPLYEGLKPTRHKYLLSGHYVKEIYEFYMKELPSLGWELTYKRKWNEGAWDDYQPTIGFDTRWVKAGFDGELTINATYNQIENHTEVIFDQHPLFNASTWIDNLPESIFIYQSEEEASFHEINDKDKIKELIFLINGAFDSKKLEKRTHTSVITIGNFTIKVHYAGESLIYLESDKGIKFMKPDPSFFELTGLTR